MQLYVPHVKKNNSSIDFVNKAPLRIAIATSLRDVIGEDKNGQIVHTSQGETYMMGVVEAIATGINNNIADMGRNLQIVGVIYDDTERDVLRVSEKNHVDIPLSPSSKKNWLHPLDLKEAHSGELLVNKTCHLPSEWRFLPKDSKEKKQAKYDWEKRLEAVAFNEMKATVLLSDHLLIILEQLANEKHRYFGRVLNIHPAITAIDDPDNLRGASPTTDAISRAKERGHCYTGSTLHYIINEIDAGHPIAAAKKTKVMPYYSPQELRVKNYVCKIAVAVAGLMHYRKHYIDGRDVECISNPHSGQAAGVVQESYDTWVEKIRLILDRGKRVE